MKLNEKIETRQAKLYIKLFPWYTLLGYLYSFRYFEHFNYCILFKMARSRDDRDKCCKLTLTTYVSREIT